MATVSRGHITREPDAIVRVVVLVVVKADRHGAEHLEMAEESNSNLDEPSIQLASILNNSSLPHNSTSSVPGGIDLRNEVGEDQRRDGLASHPVRAMPRPAAPPNRAKDKEGDGKGKVHDPDEILGLLGGAVVVVVAGAARALEYANLALEAGAVPLHPACVGQQEQEVPHEDDEVPDQGGDGQPAVDDAARDPEDEGRQREYDQHDAQAGDAMKPELPAGFGGSVVEGGGSDGAIHHVRVERRAVGIRAVRRHDASARGIRLVQGVSVGKRGIAVLVVARAGLMKPQYWTMLGPL